jgi:hypothetical protein
MENKKLKTIIQTSIKGKESLEIKEEFDSLFDLLTKKGSILLLTRVTPYGDRKFVIRKSLIKMVEEKSIL